MTAPPVSRDVKEWLLSLVVWGFAMTRKSIASFGASFTAAVLAAAYAMPAVAAPEPTGPGGVADPLVAAAVSAVGDDVFSTTDIAGLIDPTGASTQHFGPYQSTSPDSSTCGNDWATDSFDRVFTVHQNPDGSVSVVEQFKNGSFVTNGGPSPGGCETNMGGTVVAGVTGSMHGYFDISMPGETQTSSSPFCDAVNNSNTNCDTATFINTHFTPACYPVTCTVTTFFFHYSAGDQGLLFHEWKNASADRGGDDGDIANT